MNYDQKEEGLVLVDNKSIYITDALANMFKEIDLQDQELKDLFSEFYGPYNKGDRFDLAAVEYLIVELSKAVGLNKLIHSKIGAALFMAFYKNNKNVYTAKHIIDACGVTRQTLKNDRDAGLLKHTWNQSNNITYSKADIIEYFKIKGWNDAIDRLIDL